MQKLTPCLWFDGQIEEAAPFYAETFKGKVKSMAHYPDGRPMLAVVEIFGIDFQLLNGGSDFPQTEAVSFTVNTRDQEETDFYWNTLTANGGQESQCGWLKDKYGVSWQIVPEAMERTVMGPDKAGAARAMQAMYGMKRLVIADLERAYAGT